jgi:DNA-binding response OmpR family regulator
MRNGYLLGSVPLLAFVGLILLRSSKPQKALSDDQHAKTFTLGSALFDAQLRQLTINKEIIELTGTETRLLLIFASSPNETIERRRLQKEIWEDEGIIVGRSLDMFISKLRKKLELDPNIKIAVIRGKGYKLEIIAR